MREPLTVAVVQPPCVPYDVAANAVAHAAAVRACGARLVVFPEMSLTGYELDAPALAATDPRLAPLVHACAETGATALAGAPVPGDFGTAHIAVLAVSGAGARVAYRKMWLGAAEAERFTPGPAPAAVDVDGWRVGLAVCKDTGIPAHAAETAALGVDLYAAGVLELAVDAGVPEERARRIAAAHGVPVAMACFAGSTGGGYDPASGGSGVWSAEGAELARAGGHPGECVRATLFPAGPGTSIYEAAGGRDAFQSLARAHHARCLADPELSHPFSHDGLHPRHVERLGAYWAEVFGGPPEWSEQSGGHSGMLHVHAHQGMSPDLGTRFVAAFVAAADDAGLPTDPLLRATLRSYMEWAVWEVFTYDPPDTSVPRDLPMPHWTWTGLTASDATP